VIPGKIKRFYRSAEATATDEGFAVTLDGRPIRTPAGKPLRLRNAALAEALAGEWRAQGEQVEPHTMPLTQLASTAIDRVAPQRGAILDELLRYAGTDMLCYRADEPADLVRRQEALWTPLLDWAAERFGVRLAVTCGVMPADQPAEALAGLRAALEACDDLRLTALQSATAATGSLVIALALVEGRLVAETAFAVAFADEIYQAELWGDDAEAEARRERLKADIQAAERFARLAE